TGAMLSGNIAEPGIVKIAFASSDNVNSDIIATIKFLVLKDDASPLILKSLELYDSSANPLDSKGFSGKFASYFSRPKYSALMQNYPNPFNPETIIPYQLKEDTEVTIWILNAKGEVIRKLDLGHKSAGIYMTPDRAAHWDGKDSEGMTVVSGVYFYSIKAGDFSAVKKMIVTK
ncbi:T9SS type A sorting domain-containing protein, partial [Candidatus Poribacteria bacterium]|nr:T9SS type A sorting domain-containing protein [Candidatus Poribacteria bacterium]